MVVAFLDVGINAGGLNGRGRLPLLGVSRHVVDRALERLKGTLDFGEQMTNLKADGRVIVVDRVGRGPSRRADTEHSDEYRGHPLASHHEVSFTVVLNVSPGISCAWQETISIPYSLSS